MKNVITSRLSGFAQALFKSSFNKQGHAELDSASTYCVVGRAGFTLIELLVVVLIIGILAAIAVPQYQKAVLKARASEALVQGKALFAAEKSYVLSNGAMTEDLDALDVTFPANAGWTCPTSELCAYLRLNSYGIRYEVNTYFYRDQPSLWCTAGVTFPLANQICASQGEFHHTADDVDYYLILK